MRRIDSRWGGYIEGGRRPGGGGWLLAAEERSFGFWKCVPCAAFSSWLMLRAPTVEQKPPRSQSQLVWSIRSRVSAQTAGPVKTQSTTRGSLGASVFQSSIQNPTHETDTSIVMPNCQLTSHQEKNHTQIKIQYIHTSSIQISIAKVRSRELGNAFDKYGNT